MSLSKNWKANNLNDTRTPRARGVSVLDIHFYILNSIGWFRRWSSFLIFVQESLPEEAAEVDDDLDLESFGDKKKRKKKKKKDLDDLIGDDDKDDQQG